MVTSHLRNGVKAVVLASLTGIAGALAAEEAAAPSEDFLIYLGSLVEGEDEWIDPLSFEDGLDDASAEAEPRTEEQR